MNETLDTTIANTAKNLAPDWKRLAIVVAAGILIGTTVWASPSIWAAWIAAPTYAKIGLGATAAIAAGLRAQHVIRIRRKARADMERAAAEAVEAAARAQHAADEAAERAARIGELRRANAPNLVAFVGSPTDNAKTFFCGRAAAHESAHATTCLLEIRPMKTMRDFTVLSKFPVHAQVDVLWGRGWREAMRDFSEVERDLLLGALHELDRARKQLFRRASGEDQEWSVIQMILGLDAAVGTTGHRVLYHHAMSLLPPRSPAVVWFAHTPMTTAGNSPKNNANSNSKPVNM